MKVNTTSRTKVTSIVARDVAAMGSDAVIKTMGGAMDSIPLIDFREAVDTRQSDMNLWSVRRSGSGDRGKTRAWSNARTSGGGVTVTLFVTPLSTIVASAMEGGPKGLRGVGSLRTRS